MLVIRESLIENIGEKYIKTYLNIGVQGVQTR